MESLRYQPVTEVACNVFTAAYGSFEDGA